MILRVFVFGLLLLMVTPSFAQISPEVLARKELQNRGYDEQRFRDELLKKGVDVDKINPDNPADVAKAKKAVEEVIIILDREKNAGKNDTLANRNATVNPVRSVDESTKISNQSKQIQKAVKDGATIEEAVAEQIQEKSKANVPPAVTYGQHIFRDKSLQLFRTAEDAKPLPTYVLGVGDKIGVSIWGPTEENFAVEIQKDGYIQPTNLPRIYLTGLTIEQAEQLLFTKLKAKYYFNRENFELTVTTARTINVNIVGEVFNNGTYNISAINTAFNALIAAGGPNDIGSVRRIQLLSPGKKPKTLDVYQFLQNPSVSQSFYLTENDYINVPVAEKLVTISGAISRPFRYELLANENLNELIKYAGGLASDAFKANIQVMRLENDSLRVIDIDYNALEKSQSNFTLYNGDKINIRQISEFVTNDVTITGAVELPGTYAIQNGDRLYTILKKSQVSVDHMDFAYVFRRPSNSYKTVEYIFINLTDVINNPNSRYNIPLMPKDQISILSKNSYTDEAFVKVAGAVRNPGDVLYNPSLRLSDALRLSGGLKREAALDRVDIYRLEFEDNKSTQVLVANLAIDPNYNIVAGGDNFLLQPFDQIFVRQAPEFELQRNISIEGEVKYPGTYALLSDNTKIISVLNEAGSFTKEAFLRGATLRRTKDNIGYIIIDLEEAYRDPKSYENIILQEGDEIFIPKISNLVSISGATKIAEYYPDKISGENKVQAPYVPGKDAKYYIEEYTGGIANNGSASKVTVIDATGRVHKVKNFLFFKKYPKVGPGSQITVGYKKVKVEEPKSGEKDDVKWGEILGNSIAQATAILSLILLIQNVN